MTIVVCANCGAAFQRGADEAWKTLCLPCFKRGKDSERQAQLKQAEARALAAENEAANLRAHLRQAHAEIQHFFDMAMQRQAEIQALQTHSKMADELREQLPRLLLCCHPDRHGNSPAATKATQYLLRLRTRLN